MMEILCSRVSQPSPKRDRYWKPHKRKSFMPPTKIYHLKERGKLQLVSPLQKGHSIVAPNKYVKIKVENEIEIEIETTANAMTMILSGL